MQNNFIYYPLIVQGLYSGIRHKVFISENHYEISIFSLFRAQK